LVFCPALKVSFESIFYRVRLRTYVPMYVQMHYYMCVPHRYSLKATFLNFPCVFCQLVFERRPTLQVLLSIFSDKYYICRYIHARDTPLSKTLTGTRQITLMPQNEIGLSANTTCLHTFYAFYLQCAHFFLKGCWTTRADTFRSLEPILLIIFGRNF
jgi:hypothetical protein